MTMKKSYIHSAFDISYETVDHAWTMPYAHYHADYEIYILESGCRIVTIEEQEYETLAGDMVLFSPMTPHTSRGTTPFSGICIHFSEEFLKTYYSANACSLLLKCFHNKIISLSSEQRKLLHDILNQTFPHPSYRFLQLGSLLELFHTAAQQTKIQQKRALPSTKTQENKASQLISYVNENYSSIKNISELAKATDVSESYIFRIFQDQFCSTPKQYINQLRIDTILHRLRYSKKSIKVLAADCGFDCYEYFVRVFKAQTGCTPSAYRRQLTSLKQQNS